jgi:chromate transporter
MALLVAAFGAASDPMHMGLFFTQAALVTFGGAYAVLPYVIQGAVSTYGWLGASQMIDGLALGESTPGPLIMIVAFVGFLGGWNRPPTGWDAAAAGSLGACVATFFTFLPSFVFILAGGPWVERTRDDLKLTAPLTAITAAVVGVIANLSVFFALHVFWPQGAQPFVGPIDAAAVVIALVATVLLVTKRLEVIPVIALAAGAGLALWLAGVQAA